MTVTCPDHFAPYGELKTFTIVIRSKSATTILTWLSTMRVRPVKCFRRATPGVGTVKMGPGFVLLPSRVELAAMHIQ